MLKHLKVFIITVGVIATGVGIIYAVTQYPTIFGILWGAFIFILIYSLVCEMLGY